MNKHEPAEYEASINLQYTCICYCSLQNSIIITNHHLLDLIIQATFRSIEFIHRAFKPAAVYRCGSRIYVRGGGSRDFADIAQRSRGSGKNLGLKMGVQGGGGRTPSPPPPPDPPLAELVISSVLRAAKNISIMKQLVRLPPGLEYRQRIPYINLISNFITFSEMERKCWFDYF